MPSAIKDRSPSPSVRMNGARSSCTTRTTAAARPSCCCTAGRWTAAPGSRSCTPLLDGRAPRDHLRSPRVRPVQPADRGLRLRHARRRPGRAADRARPARRHPGRLLARHRRAGPLRRPHGTERLGPACSSRASRRRSPSPPRTPAASTRRASPPSSRPSSTTGFAWLTGLVGDFLNLDEYLGTRVSEETVRAHLERRRRGVADAPRGRARPAGWRTSARTSSASTSRR